MRKPMPQLTALRAFEAAARHLSLTKAAQELHVTAGALSHQIRGLEALLGVGGMGVVVAATHLELGQVSSISMTPWPAWKARMSGCW